VSPTAQTVTSAIVSNVFRIAIAAEQHHIVMLIMSVWNVLLTLNALILPLDVTRMIWSTIIANHVTLLGSRVPVFILH
jgi:hypothetical protein